MKINRWVISAGLLMLILSACFAYETQIDEHFERIEWPDGWVSFIPKYEVTQPLDPVLFEKIKEGAISG